jgi:Zn ribbon nucleic-acid-binding protein
LPVQYKKTALTKASKEKYLNDPGKVCPLCGADDSLKWVEDNQSHSKKCNFKSHYVCIICEGTFAELYKLVGIEETHTKG